MCCTVHSSGDLSVSRRSRVVLRRFVQYGSTMLAGLRWFWGFRCVDKLESKWYAPDIWCCPSSHVWVTRIRAAHTSGLGRLKPSWRDVNSLKHRCPRQGVILVVLCRYLGEEGKSSCLCLLFQRWSVSQSSVLRNRMIPGSTSCGMLAFSCFRVLDSSPLLHKIIIVSHRSFE